MIDENIKEMYSENNAIQFESLSSNSDLQVLWKCDKGHEFLRRMRLVCINGHTSCPYCTNKAVLPGFNDFYTRCMNEGKMHLINEFDIDNNPGIDPKKILVSDKKVCWVKNVERDGKVYTLKWPASIYNRFVKNQDCPYLSGQKIDPEFNSLQALFPQIAKEWDYDKNEITPDKVSAYSGKKVWWIQQVEKDGKSFKLSWQDTIIHRTKDNRNCPYLSGKAVLEGFNDLEA